LVLRGAFAAALIGGMLLYWRRARPSNSLTL
jgi:hypothetical protein